MRGSPGPSALLLHFTPAARPAGRTAEHCSASTYSQEALPTQLLTSNFESGLGLVVALRGP